MTNCRCVVQAEQIAAETRVALHARLEEFSRREFSDSLSISWLEVPVNNGFSGGKPSTATVVSIGSPVVLEQSRRKELLEQICEIWTSETRCGLDECVAVLSDPQ